MNTETDDTSSLANAMINGEDLLVTKVRDNSAGSLGILAGDFVFVREQDTAAKGEIVVVIIDGDVAVGIHPVAGGKLVGKVTFVGHKFA
jgi:SOS-response transcriptional repressor LexA